MLGAIRVDLILHETTLVQFLKYLFSMSTHFDIIKLFLVGRRDEQQDNDCSPIFTIVHFLEIAISGGLKYVAVKAQLGL